MFVVMAEYVLGDNWEEMDEKIILAVGRRSDTSSAGIRQRELIWYVGSMGEAASIKRELNKVEGVTAKLREK